MLLLQDPRFIYYNSFRENYFIVGTCRNPYHREFSVFLYHQNKLLEEKTKSLNSSQISTTIKEEWEAWIAPWKEIEEQSPLEAMPSQNAPGCGGQYGYLAIHRVCVGPTPLAPVPGISQKPVAVVDYLIRMENIEEDYNTFCKMVGIKRKTKKVPHLLSISKQWKKYLPNNILDWYTDEALEDIHRIRELDFDMLGYKKVG
jgi:hypothetical protein